MKAGGAALEDRLLLERPRSDLRRKLLPSCVGSENRLSVVIVRGKVGPEVESTPLPCPFGRRGQKIRLHDAMLMMTELGPRIRKQHKKTRKRRMGRKGFEEETCFGVDKMEIGQFGPVAFPDGSTYSFADDIDPDTNLVGMSLRIGGEEMAVAAANFPSNAGSCWDNSLMESPELVSAGRHHGEKLSGSF